ncbi:15209_t:CDS:2 [Gigaspora margarita]|uniref:15209_t:CDS:1 n=1 Tax=Gigaspora margarita TaxID=4874 RepID=A0ABN7UIA5_GIGMA|nr:15209_t:CDS:2 [Gigaspora margarita]
MDLDSARKQKILDSEIDKFFQSPNKQQTNQSIKRLKDLRP